MAARAAGSSRRSDGCGGKPVAAGLESLACASRLVFYAAAQQNSHLRHRDNVVPNHQAVVTRCAAFPLDLEKPVNTSVLRVLWLEKAASTSGAPPSRGPLQAIGAQYMGMSVCGKKAVSLGELRNFLWNLHLDDSQFAKVSKRFAPKGTYVDYAEVLYLLGRPHLQFPNVPVDALIYEAAVASSFLEHLEHLGYVGYLWCLGWLRFSLLNI
ncbi:unnamed protein product [Symbiodinium sp. CCMP2592]|nr:unnamed protein product [Symbiodinium sp. CCMP2592]